MSILQTVPNDNEAIIFTENQQANEILEKLRLQTENELFCDVVIFVEKIKFNLHRNILASFSPFFGRCFQASALVKEKFSVTSHSADIFTQFVHYMYTGTIVINKSNVNELLKLAHRLEVDRLKLRCSEYLEQRIDLNNCLKIKNLADKFDIPELSKLTIMFLKTNINEIVNQNLLLQLDAFELDSFLTEMEMGLSPVQIIGIILDWVRYDLPNRERQLSIVIKHVKCSQIDSQYLNEIIESNPMFSSSEISLFIVLKHFRDCGLTFERYIGIVEELSIKYGDLMVTERISDPCENIQKLGPAMKKKKKKKLLKGNPIARLAALRSALLLRRKTTRERLTLKQPAKIRNVSEHDDFIPLKCHLCPHYASDTTALEHHLSSIHSRDVTYKCGVCGYVCQWNNLYLEHIRGHFPGPPYKCDSCDFACDKLNEVMTHRSEHAEEKAIKCSQCSFRCRSQGSLQAHVKCHSTVPENRRSYICDVCGFSTKFLSHLAAHKRIHSADVYRCPYPHCKFTTGKKNQLGSHSKSHQGVRPHCCQICGRGFLEKSHLVRHERIHLEEKPFKCHECDYASSRRDKLKEHQARHHGDHASAKVPYKARPNKKSAQIYPDSYSPAENSGRHHGSHSSSASGELTDVLVQHHNLPLANANGYPLFAAADVHHVATSTAASAFHQQQLLGGTSRKDHRSVHQSTAAAVTAAMMLDPRFHHGGVGANPYVAPVGGIVPQTVGQTVHQVSDYPSALMSLF